MKPYDCNENYGHDIDDTEDLTVACKKTTRQRAKKKIKKELIDNIEFLDINMLNISHFK